MKKLFERLLTTLIYLILYPFMVLIVMVIDGGSGFKELSEEWWTDVKYIWGFDHE